MTAGQSQRSIIVAHPDFDRTWPPGTRSPASRASIGPAHAARFVSTASFTTPISSPQMVPLTDETRGLVKREHLLALPRGSLVVLVTRATVCDMTTLRERVLANELAPAADVWDVEPLPLDDPLLGRHNVVHTPHIAGRTRDANLAWAENLAAQFDPSGL